MTDEVLERLERIERLLIEQRLVREWYSTHEFAEVVGLAEFTIREHCRLGRLNAQKRKSGRGRYQEWAIPHAELLRFQREGLLAPEDRPDSRRGAVGQ